MSTNKRPSTRMDRREVWNDTQWRVVEGVLKRAPGYPGRVKPLFEVVAEKIPFGALAKIERDLRAQGVTRMGVYLAHDSMGFVRYAGRGHIFPRLRARFRAYPDELVYFSFYVVKEKVHEREIETLIIRAAGPLLQFNERKKRVGIQPGAIRDYEAGTSYYRRRPVGRRSEAELPA